MTRRQLLWLFIWILFFFSLFCIWSKLPNISAHLSSETTPIAKVENPLKKEMHFKLLKEHDNVTISGIVPNEDAKTKILDAYGKVFATVHANNLLVDPKVKENYLIDFFADFADNFSKFDSGYLGFHNGTMEIDGAAEHEIVQQTLKEQLALLKDIQITNTFTLQEMGLAHIEKKDNEPYKKENPSHIQEKLNALLKGKRVQFLYARDILTSDSKTLIDTIITVLKDTPSITIEVSGHTDSDGTKKNNLRLSKRRADSVKAYMVSNGVLDSHIKTVGRGESQPLVKNDTLKNRQINRRVEFKVIGE